MAWTCFSTTRLYSFRPSSLHGIVFSSSFLSSWIWSTFVCGSVCASSLRQHYERASGYAAHWPGTGYSVMIRLSQKIITKIPQSCLRPQGFVIASPVIITFVLTKTVAGFLARTTIIFEHVNSLQIELTQIFNKLTLNNGVRCCIRRSVKLTQTSFSFSSPS